VAGNKVEKELAEEDYDGADDNKEMDDDN